MVGTNFMDELDSGSFYEHIDDLLNFPNDDLDTGLLGASGDCDSFPSVLPGSSPSEALFNYDSFFSGNSASDLSAELSVPYEDIVQLEWLSNFVEDSFSGGGMTMEKNNLLPTKESSQTQFQTSSPVSVLESSSSCSNGKAIPVNHEKRARSKRPRPATFNPRPTIQLISPSSSFTETQNQAVFVPCLVSEYGSNSAESMPVKKVPKLGPTDQPKKKKKTTTKNALPSNPGDSSQTQNPSPNPNHPVRKCMHCEITKTPQWRAGPMGPKTLCNACGVRYKSGRLFPEYRPAASPTFIPSIHSNSHKKVAEMRLKCYAEKPEEVSEIEIATTSQEPEPERVPSSDTLPTSV